MADLQKILNKFNQLGIVNEGLSVDAPAVKKKQDFEFEKPKIESTDEFVAGVDDIGIDDMSALAGVSAPVKTREVPKSTNTDYSDIEARLDKIETALKGIFEMLNPANPNKAVIKEDKQKMSLFKEILESIEKDKK